MKKLMLGLSLLFLGFGCARESNNNANNNQAGIFQMNQQCYGSYSYQGQILQCGIQLSCSGLIMINQQGQQVHCL
jgi:uncharacterized protein YcfL